MPRKSARFVKISNMRLSKVNAKCESITGQRKLGTGSFPLLVPARLLDLGKLSDLQRWKTVNRYTSRACMFFK